MDQKPAYDSHVLPRLEFLESRILLSGSGEPTFPESAGGSAFDRFAPSYDTIAFELAETASANPTQAIYDIMHANDWATELVPVSDKVFLAQLEAPGTASTIDHVRVLREHPAVLWANPVMVDNSTGARAFATNQILFATEPGIRADVIDTTVGYESTPFRINQRVITVPQGQQTTGADIIQRLESLDGVRWAEAELYLEITVQTDDTYYGLQWPLHNAGDSGAEDADIDAPEAWSDTTGSPDVVIAVIDNGIELDHPDLAANIYVNDVEQNGITGDDDDGNGFVDDLFGWDFANNDNDPSPYQSDDNHGTPVAGIAAAVGWNAWVYLGQASSVAFFRSNYSTAARLSFINRYMRTLCTMLADSILVHMNERGEALILSVVVSVAPIVPLFLTKCAML